MMIAVIIYGSLYPFELRPDLPDGGPVLFLLGTWKVPPTSRGDLVANILLYMPYGFFAALAISPRIAARKRLLWVGIGGFVLCTAIELAQFYVVGRVTNMSDVYLNTFGSVLGAVGGILIGTDFRWPLLSEIGAKPFPSLLLAAWLGYRLYPYVPTIDLHKYWHAIRPLFSSANFQMFDLFRFTVIWLLLCHLLETVFGARSFRFVFLLLAVVEFVGKIFILDNVLKLADILGAGLALLIWGVFRSMPRHLAILAALMGLLVVLMRLEPFELNAAPHPFGWIPFLGFMRGSLDVDIQSFLEKFFLYGALIWILIEAGMAAAGAVMLTAVALFVTSLAEIYLPRSAELTDATMAVAIGVIYRLVPDRTGYQGVRPRANSIAGGGVRSIPAKATRARP